MFVPPDWDERYVTCFGFELEQLYARGAEAIHGRLLAAGLQPERMRTGLAFELSAQEQARRGLALLRAGYLGEPGGGVRASPEVTAILFDGLCRQLNAGVVPGARVQWEFADADPWHLRIEDGATSAAPGRVQRPDLVFRCRFEDWLDLTAGRTDPWRALVLGKLRLSGSLRMLARAPKLFT